MSLSGITINNQTVPVRTTRHKRAKNIKLRVVDGAVRITIPYFVPKAAGLNFARKNTAWIKSQLNHQSSLPQYTQAKLAHLKVKTRQLLKARLPLLNQNYGYDYTRVTIRHQKTRWGSCSSRKTLSFNSKLSLLPPALSDYIIVHELCHLKELNHSPKFWQLVARTIPNHKSLRRQLRQIQTTI